MKTKEEILECGGQADEYKYNAHVVYYPEALKAMGEYAEEYAKALLAYIDNNSHLGNETASPQYWIQRFKESLKIANENTEK